MVEETLPLGITFGLYFVVLLVLGVLAYRRTGDLEDYVLGGRNMGSWVTALSAQASDMSGWLLLGLPGLAYAAGLNAGWMVLGLIVGTYLNWKFLAPVLRRETAAADDALTLPDYLTRRFGDDSGLLRILSALVILVFFTIYTSSGLVAGGRLFETVFGLSYVPSVMVGGSVILAYTFVGGFVAVSWTDALQGSLMVLALLAAAAIGLGAVGGPIEFLEDLRVHDAALLDPFRGRHGESVGLLGVVSLLGWGLGYFGQPHILARFMAIRSEHLMARARAIAMGWVCLSLLGAAACGMIGAVHLTSALAGPDTETVFLHLSRVLFPPVVAGVLLAAVLAAIMSTADSQLLVAASAVAEDFYRGVLKPDASRRELLWVARLSVAGTALFAVVFALDPESMVLSLVAYAWAGFGAAFGPPLLLALYWDEMNTTGAAAGIVVGGITVLGWHHLGGGMFELYEIVPGFLASTAAVFLGSWLARA